MRRYDSAIMRTQLIYCICLVCLLWLMVFVIPDYVRALSCTETTYGTVLSIDKNYLGKQPVSYDYKLHIGITGVQSDVTIRNCSRKLNVGEIVAVEYTPDGSIFRIPNIFY